MIAFLDTEFTDLTDPRLLSLGLCSGRDAGPEFYAEITDTAVVQAASMFATEVVIPQFGHVEGAGGTRAELGLRLCTFLEGLARGLASGELLEIAYESDIDWTLLKRAVEDVSHARWQALVRVLCPVNVYNMPGFIEGDRAAHAYFAAQRGAALSRHHALCDARALRISYNAASAAAHATATSE